MVPVSPIKPIAEVVFRLPAKEAKWYHHVVCAIIGHNSNWYDGTFENGIKREFTVLICDRCNRELMRYEKISDLIFE